MFRHLIILGIIGIGLCQNEIKVNCYPEPGANQTLCAARGCLWQEKTNANDEYEPNCYFSPGIGFTYNNSIDQSSILVRKTDRTNPWAADFPSIVVKRRTFGNTLNVRISTDQARYEPPLDLPFGNSASTESLSFVENTTSDPYYFQVVRQSNNKILFDTSAGGLIFGDQFIQIVTYLPTENMYGWGENVHQSLKHNFSRYLTWSMFARDEPPNSANLDTKNLYGVHPYYMIVEDDGKAHGVFILNSNAQEVTTAPGPALIYRTIGGILDIYLFPGPTPEQVTQQYLATIGTPFLPSYWALGYQLSRYGYKNLDEMKYRIATVRNASIPVEIAVADIDYMDRYKDFTTGQGWEGLSDYVNELHNFGMKVILIFDPAIDVTYDSFARAISSGAQFISWETEAEVQRNIQDLYPLAKNTTAMLGVVWPDNHVAFPDFLDSTGVTQKWWQDEFVKFRNNVAYDGIWIDMNEPSSFGTNEAYPWFFDDPDHPNLTTLVCPLDNLFNKPTYETYSVWRDQGSSLATKTLCLNAVQNNGKYRFYDTKNLYGWSEAKATQQALFQATGSRGAVVGRSTFPSSGRFAGHWLGDNSAEWADLRTSVIGAQEFNLFGIPYVGSDVCGFNAATNDELCLRWQQMGAFHSFFRNHNSKGEPPEDPAEWPDVTAATIQANNFRYRHLPYLFTLHYIAARSGGTVFRPVFFEFPTDQRTLDLGSQFMWGDSMLVAPVLEANKSTINIYIPDDVWYSLNDFNYGIKSAVGDVTVPVPKTSLIPVYARGGKIVPRQQPNVTTAECRQNPFELLIAASTSRYATGHLFWDDGESIVTSFNTYAHHFYNFEYSGTDTGGNIQITHSKNCTVRLPSLDSIEIFGYDKQPDFASFKLNGASVSFDKSNYDPTAKIVTFSKSGLIDLYNTDAVDLQWVNKLSGSANLFILFIFITIWNFV